MQTQMSLFSTFVHTSFSPEQKTVLLSDPNAGALMAVYAVDDLFSHLASNNNLSFSAELYRLREKTPDPKNDMIYWLHFIQRHPYIRGANLNEQGIYLLNKSEFLLTVVHLVTWGDIDNAKFMFGENAPNIVSTRIRAGKLRGESFNTI